MAVELTDQQIAAGLAASNACDSTFEFGDGSTAAEREAAHVAAFRAGAHGAAVAQPRVIPDEQIDAIARSLGISYGGREFDIRSIARAVARGVPDMRTTEDTEAAYQRGKRAGYSAGFLAGKNGGAVVAPSLYNVVPSSAAEWLSDGTPPGAASQDWLDGWNACRNRARTLLDTHIADGVTGTPARARPLTIAQINALPESRGSWPMSMNNRIIRLIRAVERAHGIDVGGLEK